MRAWLVVFLLLCGCAAGYVSQTRALGWAVGTGELLACGGQVPIEKQACNEIRGK
jgi:hypothetical protein